MRSSGSSRPACSRCSTAAGPSPESQQSVTVADVDRRKAGSEASCGAEQLVDSLAVDAPDLFDAGE